VRACSIELGSHSSLSLHLPRQSLAHSDADIEKRDARDVANASALILQSEPERATALIQESEPERATAQLPQRTLVNTLVDTLVDKHTCTTPRGCGAYMRDLRVSGSSPTAATHARTETHTYSDSDTNTDINTDTDTDTDTSSGRGRERGRGRGRASGERHGERHGAAIFTTPARYTLSLLPPCSSSRARNK
jgi:hypothetical protein